MVLLLDEIERAVEADSPPVPIDAIAAKLGFECFGSGPDARVACARRIGFRQYPWLNEHLANDYAACLLVPERLLMLALDEIPQESLFAMRSADAMLHVAHVLAGKFIVPLAMMYGRLTDIGLLELLEDCDGNRT